MSYSAPSFLPSGCGPSTRAADAAGLEELQLWEDCFLEGGVSTAAAALAWTGAGDGSGSVCCRYRSGTSPSPPWGPPPWLAHVPRLGHPDRGTRGAGLDGPGRCPRRLPARPPRRASRRPARPAARGAAQRARAVRPVGRRSPRLAPGAPGRRPRGRHPDPVRSGSPARRQTALLLTAATSADGVRRARELVAEGRRAAGRGGAHRIVVYLLAATGAGAEDRLRAELAAEGLTSADVGVAGDAGAVAEAVRRLAEAGADTVVLQPTADEPDPEGVRTVRRGGGPAPAAVTGAGRSR